MNFSDCKSIGDVQLKQELLQMSSIVDTSTIYHYTSQAGFNGILKEDSVNFRFTRVDFLNDTTEGAHILEYYKSICKTLLSKNIIDMDFYNEIKILKPFKEKIFLNKCTQQNLEGMYNPVITDYATYAFCLSKNSDSLPLWNYYLKSSKYDGYALGFSVEEIKRQFHYCQCHHSVPYESELISVEYDEAEKEDILSDYIQALYKVSIDNNSSLAKIKHAISLELTKWQYGFKQKCFSHECEVRLIIYVPLDNQNKVLVDLKSENHPNDINKNLPTYIYVPILNKRSLREIVLPPTKNFDEKVDLLKTSGYCFKLKKSKIPVRF